MRRLWILGLLTALAVSSQIASGAVPELINFQGVLKNNGQPVSNGSHSMTFAIYSASTGGSPLWTETQSVTTNGGHFAVLLGSVTPIPASVFNASDRYLGITVPPDPELSPRQRLASVSFSYRVSTVDGATGGSIGGSLHLGAADTLFASNVSSNSPLRLQTAGTTQMLISSTGNVGIGTENPVVPLSLKRSSDDVAIFMDGNTGNRIYLLNNGNYEWSLGTRNGEETQNFNLYNYFLGRTAIFVDRGINRVTIPEGLTVCTAGSNLVVGSSVSDSWIYCYGNAYATNFFTTSDGRLKKEVTTLSNVLPKLDRLRSVNYTWKQGSRNPRDKMPGKQIGVIAQEVEKEFPELVSTGTDGHKSVDYGKLSAVLLEAVKEQQKEIEELKESVEKMRAERK